MPVPTSQRTSASGSPAPVALVTGAGSGIGAATARLLGSRGWCVGLFGRREDRLREVAADLDGVVLPGDATDPERVRAAVEQLLESFGRLDGLVLSAGVAPLGAVDEMELSEWSRTLDVNLTGPYLFCRAALPALRDSGGSIVTVASVGGLRAAPRSPAYAASKAGLIMLTRAMAVDHGPEGVRVNCVCPGWTRSEMSDAEMADLARQRSQTVEQAYGEVTAHVPQRRAAQPGEIANAIAWLLSPEASYANGAVFTIDGGTTAVDAGAIAFTSDASARGSATGS